MDENLPRAEVLLARASQDPLRGPSAAGRALEADAATMRSAVEETHAHLTRKIVALSAAEERIAALEVALARAEHDLAHARGTIRNMERSLFWRVRGVWVALSRSLGRSA